MKFTIKQLVLWCNSITTQQFSEEVYNKKVVDNYVCNKFKVFRTDPIAWFGNLDPQMQDIVSKLIAKENK